jgi:O-phospho-L-seryl-tRNASec:L-selenocysteinyl-tRNA synthase
LAAASIGFEPLVIPNAVVGDEVVTDLAALEAALQARDPAEVACIITTTSCFAPRAPDRYLFGGVS